MSDDSRFKSRTVHPELARCTECQRWASVPEGTMETARCGGCGAPMAAVDMAAHLASLPRPDPIK